MIWEKRQDTSQQYYGYQCLLFLSMLLVDVDIKTDRHMTNI